MGYAIHKRQTNFNVLFLARHLTYPTSKKPNASAWWCGLFARNHTKRVSLGSALFQLALFKLAPQMLRMKCFKLACTAPLHLWPRSSLTLASLRRAAFQLPIDPLRGRLR